MQLLLKISHGLNSVLLWAGGALLVAMMLLAGANMLFRGIWVPIMGSYELMGFFGALTIAFGLGATQRAKGHIALTILSGVFPPAVEKVIDALCHLAGSLFFGFVAWRTSVWAWSLIESGELSETLHFPYYPFPFALALGVGALALALFCDFLLVLQRGKPDEGGVEEGEPENGPENGSEDAAEERTT